MDIDDIRRTNISKLEATAGSPSAAADRVGMSYSQYLNYRNGAKEAKTGKLRGMRKETAWRFEDAFRMPRGWLDTWHDSASNVETSLAALKADELNIPLLSNAAAMGRGAPLLDEDLMIGALSLKLDWIAKHLPGLSELDSLHFIHGVGQSMEPTYNHGDVLLVDARVQHFDGNGIYVLSASDQLFIKRVTLRLDGSLQVSSDNPMEKTVEILNGDHAVEIKGRILWAWNGKRL